MRKKGIVSGIDTSAFKVDSKIMLDIENPGSLKELVLTNKAKKMKKLLVRLLTKLLFFLNGNREVKAGSLSRPEININDIQETANKAANEAYLHTIKLHYTGYDSPYKEMINRELEKQEFSYPLDLPNIMTKINESMLKEVDKIANQTIAMSFVPMLTDCFLKTEKYIKLSEILKEIIKEIEPESEDYENFNFSYEKNNRHDWLNCMLTTPDDHFKFTLHAITKYKNREWEPTGKYHLLSYPSNSYKKGYNSNMTIYKDDVKIEMPFTPDILKNKVLKLFFKYMLSSCEIEMDCRGFEDDMFPESEDYYY